MSLLILANAPLLIGVAAGVGLGICVLLFWRQAQTVDSLQKSVQRLQRAQKDAHADVRQRLETSTEAQRSLQGRLQALGQSDARIAEVASLVQALDKEVRGLADRVERAEGAGQGVQAVLSSLRSDAQELAARLEQAESGLASLESAHVEHPEPAAPAETEVVQFTRDIDVPTAPTSRGKPTTDLPPAPSPHPGDGRAAIASEEEEPSGTGVYILLFVLVGLAMLAQCAQMGS
jgi:hypothetical protein